MFPEDLDSSAVGLRHLLRVRSVGCTAQEIDAHAIEVDGGGELGQVLKPLNFKEKVNCLWLLIVIDKLWDNLIN